MTYGEYMCQDSRYEEVVGDPIIPYCIICGEDMENWGNGWVYICNCNQD